MEDLSHDELLAVARDLLAGRQAPPRRGAVDADAVAASVQAALDYEWEPPQRSISRDVIRYVDAARRDLESKRWDDALRGALGVIRGFAEGYDPGFDHDGEVAVDLQEGVGVADTALKHVKAEDLRSEVFDALLDLWWADVDHGGIGLADEVPGILTRHATRAQRHRLADSVQEKLPRTSDGWRREATAHLILDLAGDRMDDEAFLAFCRASGLHMERVERFLALGRPDDAAHAASDLPHHELTDAADVLVKAGHAGLAVGLVRARLEDPDAKNFTDRLKAWLQRHAQTTDDWAEARRLALERFRERPSMEAYSSLRSVAKRTRTWPADQQEALARLSRPEDSALLTEVHLAERRVADALESLKVLIGRFRHGWGDDSLKQRVAKAAQKEFPEASRDLYLELAEGLIARKTRAYYAQAAPFVRLACAMDTRVPEQSRRRILEDLRRRYGGHPALWDEVGKAGVGGPG